MACISRYMVWDLRVQAAFPHGAACVFAFFVVPAAGQSLPADA